MSTLPAPSVPLRPVVSAQVAGAVLVVCVVLGAAVLSAPWLLAVSLAAASVLLAWGWTGLLSLPTPRGTVGTIVLGGLAVVSAVALREDPPWLSWMPAALTLAMIAAFVHQILRRDGRPRVVQSVSAVVLALGLVGCGVLLLPASRTPEGVALVLGALSAAGASAIGDILDRWDWAGPWLTAMAMVTGGASAVGVALGLGVPWTTWLLVGVASGALSHAMRQVLAPLPTMAHARPRLVAAVASVLIVGVVPVLVALVLVPEALP
ncbi:hypothetical protein ACQBAT_12860 [Ornithinimicrobium sp. Y1847]|uniref:hypothetical protein n=1 Tax=unclassified Ornithinimicrobium TaxID=2615080 RepID=UPI003B683D3A